MDAVCNPESNDVAASEVTNGAELNNGIMKRRNNKKTSRVTVNEELLMIPPDPDQVGKGEFGPSPHI